MEIIKNKRILAIIGLGCLLLGNFLPYFVISIWFYTETISLWQYWEGKVIFVLILANALFIFKDLIEKYIPQLFDNKVGRLVEKANNPKFSLIPTILVALFAVYMLISIDIDSEYIKYGLGFWAIWLGIISLIGHAIFYKKQNIQPIEQESSQQSNQTQNEVQLQQTNPQFEQIVEQQQNVSTTKKCPYCRGKIDIDADSCSMCGSKF